METDNNNLPYKTKTIKLGFLKVLLLIVAIGIGYLCFIQFQTKVLMLQSKVLIVKIETEESDEQKYSDSVQIQSAFDKGGMIILNLDGDWLDTVLDPYYSEYGAMNSKGYFFLIGGVINFIAGQGWHLIQGPTSGLSNIYYFEK
ncbi:hypothetical protein [Clostridium sp.]|uniref:hypothetical protein n=1 Tax=Clostridium sp. TaxID=1506 RepID=UPI001A6286A0|nr:hypothetical protein [Clostridium sp.]MBK5237289.1 hypothetical protein [Clostridium sp.]